MSNKKLHFFNVVKDEEEMKKLHKELRTDNYWWLYDSTLKEVYHILVSFYDKTWVAYSRAELNDKSLIHIVSCVMVVMMETASRTYFDLFMGHDKTMHKFALIANMAERIREFPIEFLQEAENIALNAFQTERYFHYPFFSASEFLFTISRGNNYQEHKWLGFDQLTKIRMMNYELGKHYVCTDRSSLTDEKITQDLTHALSERDKAKVKYENGELDDFETSKARIREQWIDNIIRILPQPIRGILADSFDVRLLRHDDSSDISPEQKAFEELFDEIHRDSYFG